jgi:hypothetical protein
LRPAAIIAARAISHLNPLMRAGSYRRIRVRPVTATRTAYCAPPIERTKTVPDDGAAQRKSRSLAEPHRVTDPAPVGSGTDASTAMLTPLNNLPDRPTHRGRLAA